MGIICKSCFTKVLPKSNYCKPCSNLWGNFVDITGQVFRNVRVLGFSHVENRRTQWICLCICGKYIQRTHDSLRFDGCRCVKRELTLKQKENFLKGESVSAKLTAYRNLSHCKKGHELTEWSRVRRKKRNPDVLNYQCRICVRNSELLHDVRKRIILKEQKLTSLEISLKESKERERILLNGVQQEV